MADVKYLTIEGTRYNIKDATARAELLTKLTQYDTMPLPSTVVRNSIVQYKGETTSDYTQGYFYKEVTTGDPARASGIEATTTQSYTGLDVDSDKFVAIYSEGGDYSFVYNNHKWHDETSGLYLDSVDLLEYGIYYDALGAETIETNGDVLKVTVDASTEVFSWVQIDVEPEYTAGTNISISGKEISSSTSWGTITGTLSSQSDLNTALNNKIETSLIGAVNGLATLDVNQKVPLDQINDALLGNVSYQGNWDADTNTPTLPNPPVDIKGNYWIVSVAGTQFGLTFGVGDWIIAGENSWQKIDNTGKVSSVEGRTGVVTVIDDSAGSGVTSYTWSADKIYSEMSTRLDKPVKPLNRIISNACVKNYYYWYPDSFSVATADLMNLTYSQTDPTTNIWDITCDETTSFADDSIWNKNYIKTGRVGSSIIPVKDYTPSYVAKIPYDTNLSNSPRFEIFYGQDAEVIDPETQQILGVHYNPIVLLKFWHNTVTNKIVLKLFTSTADSTGATWTVADVEEYKTQVTIPDAYKQNNTSILYVGMFKGKYTPSSTTSTFNVFAQTPSEMIVWNIPATVIDFGSLSRINEIRLCMTEAEPALVNDLGFYYNITTFPLLPADLTTNSFQGFPSFLTLETGSGLIVKNRALVADIIKDTIAHSSYTWSSSKINAQKQDTLISGTNIKTVNSQTLLGSGNIDILGGTIGNVDGGYANSIYLISQNIDGGNADSTYLPSQKIDGGNAYSA